MAALGRRLAPLVTHPSAARCQASHGQGSPTRRRCSQLACPVSSLNLIGADTVAPAPQRLLQDLSYSLHAMTCQMSIIRLRGQEDFVLNKLNTTDLV